MTIDVVVQRDHRIVASAGLGRTSAGLKSNETENIEVFGRRKRTEFNSEKKIISKHQYKLLLEKEIESIRKSNEDNPNPIPEKEIKELAKNKLLEKFSIMTNKDAMAWYKDKVSELSEQNPEMSKKDVKKAASKAFEEEFGEVLPKDKPSLKGVTVMLTGGLSTLTILNPMTIFSGVKFVGKVKHQKEVHSEYDKKFEEANKPHGEVDIETPTYEVETTDENGNKVIIQMDSEFNVPSEVNAYTSDGKLLYRVICDEGEFDKTINVKKINGGVTQFFDEKGNVTKVVGFEVDENGNTIITDVTEFDE